MPLKINTILRWNKPREFSTSWKLNWSLWTILRAPSQLFTVITSQRQYYEKSLSQLISRAMCLENPGTTHHAGPPGLSTRRSKFTRKSASSCPHIWITCDVWVSESSSLHVFLPSHILPDHEKADFSFLFLDQNWGLFVKVAVIFIGYTQNKWNNENVLDDIRIFCLPPKKTNRERLLEYRSDMLKYQERKYMFIQRARGGGCYFRVGIAYCLNKDNPKRTHSQSCGDLVINA